MQPSSILGLPRGMFGQLFLSNDDAHLRKSTGSSGRNKVIKSVLERVTVNVQRRVGGCVLVLLEPGIWVVVKVVGVLPYLPGNVEALVDLEGCLPCKGVAGVCSGGACFTTYNATSCC